MSYLSTRFRLLLIVTLAAGTAVLLVGCGSTVSTPSARQTGIYTDVSGNWQLELQSSSSASGATLPFYKLAGSLVGATSSPNVAGVLQVYTSSTSPCTPPLTAVAVSGTMDSSNNLHLSFPLAAGMATIDGNLVSNLEEIFGSVQIAGGSCAVAPTPALIFRVGTVSGKWVGILQNSSLVPGQVITSTVTADLMQASTANANGAFPLTGTVTSSGACNDAFTFEGGQIIGTDLDSDPNRTIGAAPHYLLGSGPRYGAISIPIAFVAFQRCSGVYAGALTKP